MEIIQSNKEKPYCEEINDDLINQNTNRLKLKGYMIATCAGPGLL